MKAEIDAARQCLFCRIRDGEIPAEIIYREDGVLAFRDIDLQAPVHVLIIPEKHIASLAEAGEPDDELLGRICRTAALIARRESIEQSGYRLVVNNGPDAGQAVDHLHFHLLGGRSLGWPPG
ncbi:MAG: histidine triad nucleotide-binding protein [Candidatus Erginobacter occultus]|nr:histidine triad nucleotide-binding protein [Candidatus Erginobacter occultus]